MASEFVGSWGVSHPFGDAMALLAALLWASSTLLIKGTKLARIDPAKVLLYQIGLTSIVCTAAAWALGERAPTDLSASTYAALLWQGAVIVGVSFVVWI
jgi:drug/metabolite transporter (DMT)-like permease